MRLGGESLPGGVYFVDGQRCALALEGPRGVEVEVWAAPFPRLPRPLLSFAALAYALVQHVRAYRQVMERVARGGEGERPMSFLEVGLAVLITLLNAGLILGLALFTRQAGEAVPHPLLGKTLVHLFPLLVLLLALRLLMAVMGGDVLRKHAAEHQVLHLVDRGLPLTLEGAKAMPPLHPRCGFNVLGLAGMLFLLLGLFLPAWLALLLSLPLAYEAAGSPLAVLGYPLQRLFLAPPKEEDLEVALAAARALLEEGVPG